jgi:hypothetical protein
VRHQSVVPYLGVGDWSVVHMRLFVYPIVGLVNRRT